MAKPQENQRFVIIDGNAIIHRVYHAIPPLTTKDGTIVNAVFGFTSMLLKVMDELKPTHLAVSFDVAGGTFRDELYEDYKATRVKADQDLYDQIPLVYDVVNAFNIPIYTKEGYEADDVIGTIVKKVKEKGVDSVIVTGDMDMLQLVDDGDVQVYELRRGLSDIVMFDDKKVIEKYGFGPERVVDYKALRGDSSDNIPGVRGIGEKTAKALIEKVGSVEEIYKALKQSSSNIRDEFKPGVIKKLEEGKEDAKMSKELATIHTGVTKLNFKLSDAVLHEFDHKEVKDLLHAFEFFSLVKRVPGMPEQQTQKTKTTKKKAVKKVVLVTKENEKDALAALKKERVLVCREVLGGDDVLSASLLGFVFLAYGKPYFVDWNKVSATAQKAVLALFADTKRTLVGHDVKQVVKAVRVAGGVVRNTLFDVMIASYVTNSSTRAHDLQSMVVRELGQELPASSEQTTLFGVDPQAVAQELYFVDALYQKFVDDLKKNHDRELFDTIEMALIPVLAQMELYGVAVDTDMLKSLSRQVATALDKVTKKIWKEAGEEFNVASSVQLREVLFEKMGLPTEGIKKGKTGYSTAASELEKLRDTHPIIELIEEHRELAKLQNTYVDVLPTLIHKKTGRIHTSFNQAVAATGRLSSSDPNLQNIPIRTELGREIRKAFVAAKGYTLIAADYSQFELRIVASLAKDKKLIKVFKGGEDVHTATAAAINGVKPKDVTREMRYAAKAVNFGILYGMGAYGLAWRAGIPQWQAKEFIDAYFAQFAGVKAYVDKTIAFAKKEGYVETSFGRRRYIPEMQSQNYQLRAAGERMAVNMPIQGTQADYLKLAMIAVQQKIEKDALQDEVRMLLQVHDELVFEVKKGKEKVATAWIKQEMERVVDLLVPVEVEVGIGHRWGEIK